MDTHLHKGAAILPQRKDMLCVHDGCILLGNHLVVPGARKLKVIEELRQRSHRQRAWPKLLYEARHGQTVRRKG